VTQRQHVILPIYTDVTVTEVPENVTADDGTVKTSIVVIRMIQDELS